MGGRIGQAAANVSHMAQLMIPYRQPISPSIHMGSLSASQGCPLSEKSRLERASYSDNISVENLALLLL